MKKYYKRMVENNPEFKAKRKAWGVAVRTDVINHYGGLCECCGEKRMEFLCIDHINGKGKTIGMRSGNSFYRMLRREKYPNGFRVLCHNCNMAIGFYGYCPHTHK